MRTRSPLSLGRKLAEFRGVNVVVVFVLICLANAAFWSVAIQFKAIQELPQSGLSAVVALWAAVIVFVVLLGVSIKATEYIPRLGVCLSLYELGIVERTFSCTKTILLDDVVDCTWSCDTRYKQGKYDYSWVLITVRYLDKTALFRIPVRRGTLKARNVVALCRHLANKLKEQCSGGDELSELLVSS